MKKICNIVRLLKKHGRMGWVWADLCWMALSSAVGTYYGELNWMILAIGVGVLMILWEISDTMLLEKLEDKNKEVSDRDETIETLHKQIGEMASDLEVASSLLTPNKANPIKSNRIVSDKTFAVRLRSFVSEVNATDAASVEEKDYLLHVADRLLSWQTKTVRRESSEAEYLRRLNLMPVEPEHQAELPKEQPKEQKQAPKKRTVKKKLPKKQETEDVVDENKD